MSLWPHQIRGLAEVRACMPHPQRVLVVAPCGSGKTRWGAEICTGAVRKQKRVLWIAHTSELVDQPVDVFRGRGLPVGIFQSSRPSDPDAAIQVATIQTLARRQIPFADVVIFDEAHLHFGTKTQQRIIEALPGATLMGLSATPWLLSGRPMGDLYKALVIMARPSELLAQGILVRPRAFGPRREELQPNLTGLRVEDGDYRTSELAERCNRAELVGDIAQTYLERARKPDGTHRSAILFAADREHSKSCRDALIAVGIRAEHVDADTPSSERNNERKRMLDRLRSGETQVLCNVQILTAGFDYRGLECVVLARPTQSLALYLQCTGRVMRSEVGKSDALILDHVGSTITHGFAHADHNWTLESSRKYRQTDQSLPPLRTCLKCFAVFDPMAACPECGTVFPVTARMLRQAEGELEEIHVAPTKAERLAEFQKLCRVAIAGRMNRDFVKAEYQKKFGVAPRGMEWPTEVRENLAKKRAGLEEVARRRGYLEVNGKFPWVERMMGAK